MIELTLILALAATATPQDIVATQEITPNTAGFNAVVPPSSRFGSSVAPLGDLDGDGVGDIAVGGDFNVLGGPQPPGEEGGVWILFLNSDGTVKDWQKIDGSNGGLVGTPAQTDRFGKSVCLIGDVDGDGVKDIAVGEQLYGLNKEGAVWILFLNSDGTVKDEQFIAEGYGGLQGQLGAWDEFGMCLTGPGDVDGDGIADLAVGAAGYIYSQKVYVLLLNADGTVKGQSIIEPGVGGFVADPLVSEKFGRSLASLGDLSGDGTLEIAVGALGKIWILSLDSAGFVVAQVELSETSGGVAPGNLGPLIGFPTPLSFGKHIGALGDMDQNGTIDLLMYPGASNVVAIPDMAWVLYLNPDGTVADQSEFICDDGQSMAGIGDINGDGYLDAVAGSPYVGGSVGSVNIYMLRPALAAWSEPYEGCAMNTSGSLVAAGQPAIGEAMDLLVDNPFGSQDPGAFPLLAISASSSAPCSQVVQGWNMDPGQGMGELLLQLPVAVKILGTPWGGPGIPGVVTVNIPNNPALMGETFSAQAFLLDLTGPKPIAASSGLLLHIGN